MIISRDPAPAAVAPVAPAPGNATMLRLCLTLILWFQASALAGPPRLAYAAGGRTIASAGFFDDIFTSVKSSIAEVTKEVSVQHVLVPNRLMALKLQQQLRDVGVTPETVGSCAQQFSTCGSAKKTPDARMPQLRGRPGELVFKRGEMAKEFERAAFEGAIGSLQLVETQYGVHLILINARTGEDAPPAPAAASSAPAASSSEKTPAAN